MVQTLRGALTLAGDVVAVSGEAVAAELADAVRRGNAESLRVDRGTLRIVSAVPWGAPASGAIRERSIDVDMTNWSAIVDEAVVVKVFRVRGAGDRAARQLATLAGTRITPGFRGAIEWEIEGRSATLAVITDLVDNATDGWTWAVEEVVAYRAGGPEPLWPSELGELVARMHRHLAGTAPISAGARSGPEIRARARSVLEEALDRTSGEAGRRLRNRLAGIRDAIESVPDDPAGVTFDLHGDLHVGQVLRTADGYRLLDFDGDPQLSRAESNRPDYAARDVAHMTSSIELVAAVAMRLVGSADSAIAQWARRAQRRFLLAYRNTAGDLLDERLLPGMHAEQLLRELVYADRFLHRWRYAADGALSLRFPPDVERMDTPWTPPASSTT